MRLSKAPRVLHSTGVVPLPGAIAVALKRRANDGATDDRGVDERSEAQSDLVIRRDVARHRRATFEPARHPLTREARVRMDVLRGDHALCRVGALKRYAEAGVGLHQRRPRSRFGDRERVGGQVLIPRQQQVETPTR